MISSPQLFRADQAHSTTEIRMDSDLSRRAQIRGRFSTLPKILKMVLSLVLSPKLASFSRLLRPTTSVTLHLSSTHSTAITKHGNAHIQLMKQLRQLTTAHGNGYFSPPVTTFTTCQSEILMVSRLPPHVLGLELTK
jgi:hypothetical protein